jgi:myo-inositol-1(or 4)-monophosphatase
MKQELFTASRGEGATLNNRRIRVTRPTSSEGALLGTGFPFRLKHHFPAYQNMFAEFFRSAADVRRAGSAALDLAYVAAGRLDGFWEIGLAPWDMAAGALIIREAGGLVGDFHGDGNFLQTGNIVAANPKLFADMIRKLQPHLTDELKA